MTAQPVALSRRRFLVGAGASAAGALALPSLWPRYAFATPGEPATGDALVVVFLRGGAELGALTLVRFYALHVFILPVVLVVGMLLHFAMVRKQGIAKPL